MESELATQLFIRSVTGLELTVEGQRAVDCANGMFVAVESLVESTSGADARPSGVVRISCADTFSAVLVPALAELRKQYAQLRVELVTDNHTIDVRKREADIAVRMYRDERSGLVIRKLGEVGWSLYAAQDYLDHHGAVAYGALAGHDIVGYDDSMAKAPGAAWLASNTAPANVVFRGGSPRAAIEAVKSGLGISALPCWLTDGEKLVRLTPEVIAQSQTFAVYAPELRSVRRVQVVVECLVQWFRLRRDWLGGTAGSPAQT
jgi:DNA-binding transcriptional LysR family regulator